MITNLTNNVMVKTTRTVYINSDELSMLTLSVARLISCLAFLNRNILAHRRRGIYVPSRPRP